MHTSYMLSYIYCQVFLPKRKASVKECKPGGTARVLYYTLILPTQKAGLPPFTRRFLPPIFRGAPLPSNPIKNNHSKHGKAPSPAVRLPDCHSWRPAGHLPLPSNDVGVPLGASKVRSDSWKPRKVEAWGVTPPPPGDIHRLL